MNRHMYYVVKNSAYSMNLLILETLQTHFMTWCNLWVRNKALFRCSNQSTIHSNSSI